MGLTDCLDLVIVSLDTVLTYILYDAYKTTKKSIKNVEQAPEVQITENLNDFISENQPFPYVCVKGVTRLLDKHTIVSSSAPLCGLIKSSELIEHRSIRNMGGWQDYTEPIHNNLQAVKFGLSDSSLPYSNVVLEVKEPLTAEFFLPYLPIVHHVYEPVKQELASKSLDILFGNILTGHSYQESMLLENVPMMAIGRLSPCVNLDPTLNLRPLLCIGPSIESHMPFILTSLSKEEVIQNMESEAKLYKFSCALFGLVGAGLFSVYLYKLWHRKKFAINRWFHNMRREKCAVMTTDAGINPSLSLTSVSSNSAACIVCLNTVKDLLLLPCKHVCICSRCFEVLPLPKKCPVCRAEVKEHMFIYNC